MGPNTFGKHRLFQKEKTMTHYDVREISPSEAKALDGYLKEQHERRESMSIQEELDLVVDYIKAGDHIECEGTWEEVTEAQVKGNTTIITFAGGKTLHFGRDTVFKVRRNASPTGKVGSGVRLNLDMNSEIGLSDQQQFTQPAFPSHKDIALKQLIDELNRQELLKRDGRFAWTPSDQFTKHGAPVLSVEKLAVLTKEVGEVTRLVNETLLKNTKLDTYKLREELIQTAAVATAWVAAINYEMALWKAESSEGAPITEEGEEP